MADHSARNVLLAGTAFAALLGAVPALAQDAPATPPTESPLSTDPIGDEGADIVVTGIRASLASAINQKRNADNIVDVINAQDVGKLPDQNLAEVLENVSGVQIDRSQGVGSNVSIRGSNQNLVLINGRATTPAGDARGGISFDDLPAELIASVEVTKVATADQIEGSVGGIVDLKTYRGLGLKEPIASLRADMEYAETADSWNPRISAVYGRTFDTSIGEIGFVLSGAYGEQTVREDIINVRYAARTTEDLDGDGVADPYLRPNYAQQFFTVRDRKNGSLSGSVEWQASSNLKLFADGTYVNQRIEGDEAGVFIQQAADVAELAYPGSRVIEERNAGGYSYRQLVSGTIGGTQIRPVNSGPLRATESYLAAGGAEWESDRFTVKFEASRAGSTTTDANFQLVSQYNDPASPAYLGAGGRISAPFLFDITGDDLFFGPDRSSGLFANTTNPNYFPAFIARDTALHFRNVENAQRLDMEWKAELGPLRSIQFGARFNQTDSERRRFASVSGQFPGITAANRPDLFTRTSDDFFSFTGRDYFDGFIVPVRTLTENPQVGRTAFGLPAEAPEDVAARFRVEERTYAGYVRLNLDTTIGGIGLRGNAGVRMVHTNQTAFGSEILNGVAQPVEATQKYTYWLPNAMLVAEPMDKLLLRASYGRTMRRPDFGQLSPTVQFPLLDVYVTAGNPTLRPQTVDQFDAAVEWYFDRNSILSIGGFYKKYQDLVTTVAIAPTLVDPARGPFDPTNCATGIFNPISVDQSGVVGECVGINQPVNAGSATLKGLELNFQHSFTYLPGALDGLGVIANYTYQDGKRETTFTVPGVVSGGGAAAQFELPLRDLSENNYNLTLFYEKFGINARVRYTFRDPFLRTEAVDLTNNLPLYQDKRHQLNASISVDINPQFAVTLSGVNLTNQPNRERAIFIDGPIGQERIADRRWAMGVRGKF